MKALDFEYDGTLASSKGIVVCSFDSSDDERKKVLKQRYNSLLHTVQQEMNTLLDFNRI